MSIAKEGEKSAEFQHGIRIRKGIKVALDQPRVVSFADQKVIFTRIARNKETGRLEAFGLDENLVAQFLLGTSWATVGRSPQSHLRSDSQMVSNNHGKIRISETLNKVEVVDTSRNGTYLGDEITNNPAVVKPNEDDKEAVPEYFLIDKGRKLRVKSEDTAILDVVWEDDSLVLKNNKGDVAGFRREEYDLAQPFIAHAENQNGGKSMVHGENRLDVDGKGCSLEFRYNKGIISVTNRGWNKVIVEPQDARE